jgi:hypothetical protein
MWQQQQQPTWADQFAVAAPAAADQLTALQAELVIRHQEAALAAAATAASEAAAVTAGSLYALQQQLANQRAILNMQGGSSNCHDAQMDAALLALQGQGLSAAGPSYLAGPGGLQLGHGWALDTCGGSMAAGLATTWTPAWVDVMTNVAAHTNTDSMMMLAMQLHEQQQQQQQVLQQQHYNLLGGGQAQANTLDWVLPCLP